MGRGIMVYSVDQAALEKALGSNTPDLLEQLEAKCDDDIWPQVMQLLKSGTCRGRADQQIFAFEALCQHFGVELDNSAVSPILLDTISEVDRALLAHPCQLSFEDLVYGQGVFEFYEASDFPQFGHWSTERLRAAAPLLERQPPKHSNPDLEDILLAVSDWVTVANARSNALFGFIY